MYLNRTIKCLKRLQKGSIDDNLRQLVFMRMALAFHPLVDGVFGHQKRGFSKTVSKVEIFKNAVLSFLRVYTSYARSTAHD